MKMKKWISFYLSPMLKMLQALGKILNQSPDKGELKKLRHSPLFNNPFKLKNDSKGIKKSDALKDLNSHPKGSVKTETAIFNKLRK